MNFLAAFKGYRTVLFNLIMTAAMIASMQGWIGPGEQPDATAVNLFLDNLEGFLTAIWGVGNLVLRAVTTTPLGQKE